MAIEDYAWLLVEHGYRLKGRPGVVVGWTPNSLSLLIRTIALHTVKAVTGVAGAVGACWSLVSWAQLTRERGSVG